METDTQSPPSWRRQILAITSSKVRAKEFQNSEPGSMTDRLVDSTLLQMTQSLPTVRRFTPLPEVFLAGDSVTDQADEPQEVTIARAEARARSHQRRNGSRMLRGTDRQFAEALHREADNLHYKGDYETALVLYHRAASLCPRDSSHGVAVRRTAAAIHALSHPSKTLNGLLPRVKNLAQQSAMVCPESAAVRASRILSESPDPVSVVPQILQFFDGRADFWRMPKTRVTPSRKNFAALERPAAPSAVSVIRRMETVLNSGDAVTALQIGDDILANLNHAVTESDTLNRHRITVYRLITLAHVALRRHDRAAASACKMTRTALSLNIPLLITQALVTLGKVHLSFGHLNAAATAWERLVPRVSEPVPRAWLFHEIGRCHLENGDPKRALDLATRCLDTAEAVDCEKWTFHGRLLLGQALAQLGRFTESLSALRSLTLAGDEAGDARTLAYVHDLAQRVAQASDSEIKSPPRRSQVLKEEKPSTESEEDDLIQSSSNFTAVESLYFSDEKTPKFEAATAAGDPGDPGEQESSIAATLVGGSRASHESIPTGRTYGVPSPLFRRSMSKATPKFDDVSESEDESVTFGTEP